MYAVMRKLVGVNIVKYKYSFQRYTQGLVGRNLQIPIDKSPVRIQDSLSIP